MLFNYNGNEYNVIIEKKYGNKNTYIRVKRDLNIYVTTGMFTSTKFIKNLIDENRERLNKMIDAQEIKIKNNEGFFYLGKKYEVINTDEPGIKFIGDKVYINPEFDIDAWYKKQDKPLFLDRLNYNYERFTRKIPYPNLRIRKMKTRWGVCNVISHNITLNLELMKRDISYLDYVIIHEMSHLIYGDHSDKFWALVGENVPNYKKYKEEMKEF